MPEILHAAHVLAVPDAAATARFFVEKLGFALEPVADEGWRFVARGACRVMIGHCPDALRPADLGDHSYFAYLTVDDVDALAAELQAKGVPFLAPPADKPWGMRELPLATPDGHRLMFGAPIA